jgi:ribosome-binding ATPase YchF (GTP1/OBG family)
VDPHRDLTDFLDELILKDLAVVETRLGKVRKAVDVGVKGMKDELPLLERCITTLEAGTPLRDVDFNEEDEKVLRGYGLLTAKPLLIVFNVGDETTTRSLVDGVSADPRRRALEINGKAEMELAELPEEEAQEFVHALGIAESGLVRVIHASYELLGFRSFYTVGEQEVRAWTITAGTSALGAADKIHSDIARGFIRAEVLSASDLLDAGGWPGAKAQKLIRVEGREYVVQEGDVLNIRFSV